MNMCQCEHLVKPERDPATDVLCDPWPGQTQSFIMRAFGGDFYKWNTALTDMPKCLWEVSSSQLIAPTPWGSYFALPCFIPPVGKQSHSSACPVMVGIFNLTESRIAALGMSVRDYYTTRIEENPP